MTWLKNFASFYKRRSFRDHIRFLLTSESGGTWGNLRKKKKIEKKKIQKKNQKISLLGKNSGKTILLNREI